MDGDNGKIFVKIEMDIKDSELSFSTENNTNGYSETKSEPQGIGLMNSRKRLEILYPNDHDLRVIEDQKVFKTQLTLKLDQHGV